MWMRIPGLLMAGLLLASAAHAEATQATITMEATRLDDALSEILQELARLEGASENASINTCRRMHADLVALRRKVSRLQTDVRELSASATISVSVEAREQRESDRRRRRERASPPEAPQPVIVVPEPLPPVPAGPFAMGQSDFQRLISRMQAESFGSGKLRVLDDAADYAWFTSAQIVRILSVFSFPSEKVKALELIARNIVDHENAFEIYDAFTFESDKEKARQILRAAR